MAVIRLWERTTDEGTAVVVIERSDAALARPRALGGRVFDVTVDRPPFRKAAEATLDTSRLDVSPESDDAGRVARARRAVVEVSLSPASGQES